MTQPLLLEDEASWAVLPAVAAQVHTTPAAADAGGIQFGHADVLCWIKRDDAIFAIPTTDETISPEPATAARRAGPSFWSRFVDRFRQPLKPGRVAPMLRTVLFSSSSMAQQADIEVREIEHRGLAFHVSIRREQHGFVATAQRDGADPLRGAGQSSPEAVESLRSCIDHEQGFAHQRPTLTEWRTWVGRVGGRWSTDQELDQI